MKELSLTHIVLIYLAVIIVVTFFVYGIDKWKAKKSKWRIRETALLGLAIPRYACWPFEERCGGQADSCKGTRNSLERLF